MDEKKINELSNEELLDKKKKGKINKIINAVFIGFCIGIAVYSASKKGLSFATIAPLLLAVFAYKYFGKNEKLVDEELKSRDIG